MLPFVLFASVLLACVPHVFAARSITISGDTSSLSGENILTLTASTSGFVPGETVYIKGAFFQSGMSNYFGFTKNGELWVKNSASNTTQRSVKIGEWDGVIQTKVDYSDSGYKGEGDYLFKLRFYYGSSLTADWSANEIAVAISEPDPTITPTLSPTNTPVPTVSPTQVPTSTVSVTVLATKSPTHTLFISPTSMPLLHTVAAIDVLGASSSTEEAYVLGATPNATLINKPVNSLRPLGVALSFIAVGFALLSLVAVWHNRTIWLAEMQKK